MRANMKAGDKNQQEEQQRKDQQEKERLNRPTKQDEPHKKHGVPDNEEEGSRFGGLNRGNSFKKNMGCGG